MGFSLHKPWSEERKRRMREKILAAGGFWTDERSEVAKTMWLAGGTQKAIAQQLGCTPSQVGSFVFREHLMRRGGIRIAMLKCATWKSGEITAPSPFVEPTPLPAAPGGFEVYEVRPETETCTLVARFQIRVAAQKCANKAHEIEGAFRLIYKDWFCEAGVCWKPVPNEQWDAARLIVERSRA